MPRPAMISTTRQYKAIRTRLGHAECPRCRGEDITSEGVEPRGDCLARLALCESCDYRWTEVFALSHIIL